MQCSLPLQWLKFDDDVVSTVSVQLEIKTGNETFSLVKYLVFSLVCSALGKMPLKVTLGVMM